MKYDAVSAQQDDQSQSSGDQPSEDGDSSDIIFIAGAFVVVLISTVAIVIGTSFASRRGPSRNSILHQEPQTVIDSPPFTANLPIPLKSSAPPPPPMIAPLPPGGLPPGWTMEQWHYYGEEYLEKFYGDVNSRDR